MSRVGVIGAGPAGVVVSRYLLSEGFEPTLFERGSQVGGQWTGEAGHSGVWPTLHTNTSRVLTAFSDLPMTGDAVFPWNGDVRAYVEEYARRFGVLDRVRFGTAVRELRRAEDGWTIELDGSEETFEHVIVATGRFHAPFRPDVAGLDAFTGSEGVISTYDYKEPSRYVGKRVLVAGCAVSALEIASDLAALGAARVAITQRRQRYVLPKFAAGVPSDHRIFTRYGVLANEWLPRDEVGQQLKQIVLEAGGSPEQYGAPPPADDFFAAGVTLNQQYLPLVAEGRIGVHPWIRRIEGNSVEFDDGTAEEFDAIILGTGFVLDLPFLSDEIQATLDLDEQHADLFRHTFHPDLPGVAFLGMWDQSGGYFVPLELQARWVADRREWRGRRTFDRRATGRDRRLPGPSRPITEVTDEPDGTRVRAGAAGVEPDPRRHPGLLRALMFGPLAPSSFRLEGHDALHDAAERFARDAATFGAITTDELTDREIALLRRLEAERPTSE